MRSRFGRGLVGLVCILALVTVPLALGAAHKPAKTHKHAKLPGNVAVGKKVFVAFCGKCHAMAASGSKGTLGPNLDHDKVAYTRVVTAVREGIGGIQAEYTFANKCSPTSSRCLTWKQLYSVAKFVVVARR